MTIFSCNSRIFQIGSAVSQALAMLVALLGLTPLPNASMCLGQEAEIGACAEPLSQASLISAIGEHYGVGRVELPLSLAMESGWHSDQSLEVHSSDCQIWLPTYAKVFTSETSTTPDSIAPSPSNDLLRIYFLYHGQSPATVEIHISGKAGLTIRSEESEATYNELLQSWWDTLNNQHTRIPPALQTLTNDMLFSIGKHLGMPPTARSSSQDMGSSELEHQFERTLGMLLGFESVRLAMMTDDQGELIGSAPAIEPLPNAVDVVSQSIPGFAMDSNGIEPIASFVPNDCYYVRCGSLNNYMWLRQFLIGWGGSLDEIVTNPILNTDVRSQIEDQLGIYSDAWQDAEPLVTDMAVIGSDLFFTEGAGIGILLEAKPGDEQKLETIIQQQRLDKSKQLGANHQSVMLSNHKVSYFRTADNRMRSFFVRHGRYLLLTNSQAMLNSITSPQAAAQSLASLPEYRYALASNPLLSQAGITIYLSDPFIRRLTSPACRIELGRRRESAAECRQLEVAAMVAVAFGQILDSRESLIAHNYLPEDFGILPDGSYVELRNGVAFDSLRGKVGTFVPVADVAPTKANQRELSTFSSFAQRYRTEWRAVDPVLVTIASSAVDESDERVEVQIHITPYARQEYRFLTNYLSQPSETHVSMSRNELLGLSARLKAPSREFLAHLGVVDAVVPFRIHQGRLLRADGVTGTFLQQQSFAAVTPSGTDGLQAISGLMQSLQNRSVDIAATAQSPAASQSSSIFNPYTLSSAFTNPVGLAFSSSALVIKGVIDIAKLGALDEDGQWSIYGGSSELRRDVRTSLATQYYPKPSQLLFRAGGVDGAMIAPYLNAYSYCQSRNQSAAIASWLNQWSIGLRSQPMDFRENIEQALQGELMCPLGGQFTLDEQSQAWTSSKWEKDSLALEDHVPEDYRFPFLRWLKEVELRFNLSPTSLNTDVAIQVARPNRGGSPPLELKQFSRQH